MACLIESASELDNLLQIIGGTTDLMENIWGGRAEAGKYLTMLRTSVDRAAKVTAQMVEQAGGATNNALAPSGLQPLLPVALRAGGRRKQRILVVDDEPLMLGLFERLLTEAGYDVATAESGCQALDLLSRNGGHYDLVLLDFAMPFMTGEETFRRLRALSPGLRIILAAGFIDRTLLDDMLAEGLVGFICKPVPPDELLAFVARSLAHENTNSSTARGIQAAN